MRLLLAGLCAVAAAARVADPAAVNSAAAPIHKPAAETAAPPASVACLGGVLAEGRTEDYLTVADYPAFAALAAGLRRTFICGDSIPSFLPSSERAGFASRHH